MKTKEIMYIVSLIEKEICLAQCNIGDYDKCRHDKKYNQAFADGLLRAEEIVCDVARNYVED